MCPYYMNVRTIVENRSYHVHITNIEKTELKVKGPQMVLHLFPFHPKLMLSNNIV